MSIYRNTEVSFSFGAEMGAGGYIDYISAVTDAGDWTALINLASGLPAGSRSVTFDTASGTLAANNYIALGSTANGNQEIRRISSLGSYNGTDATGTVYLDYPTGFFHGNNEVVDEKTVPDGTLAGDSMVTFLPGVYETITVPDMAVEILPQYFLGTASVRNPFMYLRGRQAFSGSLSTFILLNGYALRFPIGTVRTVATAISGGSSTSSAATSKGQRFLPMTDGTNFANGDYIEIERGGTNPEVRQIISGAAGAGAQTFVLNYPMGFAHASGVTVSECTSGTTFAHTMVETADLDSMTWHVRMKDSSATADTGGISWLFSSGTTATNSLTRRWVGGKVGRATIAADEGGLLLMSWDEVPFLDLVHNQRFHSSIGSGTTNITKFGAAVLNPDAVGSAIPHSGGALGTPTLPTTEPYYFSQGSISFFGVEFARIRSFRIEINNNLDPRYYIRNEGTERIPFEIIEGRREYTMSATVSLPDAIAANATTRSLFKELLLEGNYGSGMAGFDMSLTFTRGVSDTIVITIPPSTAATGGDAQGAYITRATHNIGTESPIQADLEMSFRAMRVVVTDLIPDYP